ncbi:hypothetical protein HNY73_016122 [Argiope bruennichi]|uniref:Uncharacterized protein n=1 Tax=Argiope bruennichi TaxID=94029 RepID=A0A8T0EI02_ARGBR|nr:hypothetical protein HNY73_016122 [Argiope bruennichi]
MFKNTKKKDLIIVAEAIGEVVPEKTNIVQLKQIIENSQAAKDDLEFVKDIIISTVEEREKIEAEERGKIEAERAREKERQFELEKLKLTLAHEKCMRNVQATGISSPNEPPPESHAEFIEQIIKSIHTLTMPILTKSENFNLFFNILERAFETKQSDDISLNKDKFVDVNLITDTCFEKSFSDVNSEWLVKEVCTNVLNVYSENDFDIGYLSDKNMKDHVINLISNYSRNKIRTTDLQMSIILTDDIPVTSPVRRLAPIEKQQVTKQIEEWLAQVIKSHIIKNDYGNIQMDDIGNNLILNHSDHHLQNRRTKKEKKKATPKYTRLQSLLLLQMT